MNETAIQLIKKQKEYIELLGKSISRYATYLHTHGMHYPQEDIDQGKKLREEIIELEKSI